MALASKVPSWSEISERGGLFPEILSHLRRLHPEVYGPAVSLGWRPMCREFSLREDGEGLSCDNLSVESFSKFRYDAGRFENISPSIAKMNYSNPILTNVYIDNPPVGPTSEPLEYPPPHQDALGSLIGIPIVV